MESFMSLFIVASLSFLLCVLASGKVDQHEMDRLALLEVKANIADPEGVLSSWNDSAPLCEWSGVLCGRKHQRVTVLDLSSCGLSGFLSPHVGNLSFLRQIYLQNNSFGSAIPSEIGNLKRLRVLYLHNNSFTGQIPSNLSRYSSIIAINLGRNRLVGNLPPEISSLSKLEMLNLHVNNFVGNIPASFANLSSLQHFNVYTNNLDGQIPETLGKLKNLIFLNVAVNNLSGSIPRSIFNITSLKVLEMSVNKLEGTLPTDIGITLPNIVAIGMGVNMLSGSIPKSLPNASNLAQISIPENYFAGDVASFATKTGLLWLNIGQNQLGNGKPDDLRFICSLTNSTILAKLGIDGNNFGGAIPECVGNLSSTLQELAFSDNKISGILPASIGNLIGLKLLLAWGNNLQGKIPSRIGHLKNLNALHLHTNSFSGRIPSSLGNLDMLVRLYLAGNNLDGSIPSTLGRCQNLLVLDLSENKLGGLIPPEILGLSSLSIALDLSGNNLTGPLPAEVGSLTNLNKLRLSGNRLLGVIPATIGSCDNMVGLYLEDNFFEGPIPSSLKSLRGLKVLNLSSNRLSGQVPEFLQFLNLTSLSLSDNDLEGALPTKGVFGNASSVSVAGNTKLCGGLPEFHLPKCHTKDSGKLRLSRLAKILIFAFSGLFVAVGMLATAYLLWYGQKRKSTEPSSSDAGFLRVSYHILFKATNGFSSENLIGVGSFGSVYKGLLDHIQATIAVKVLDLTRYGASRSFVAECETLRNIRHRNLVKVLSACSGFDQRGDDFKALVYEFLSNGSLEEWLHLINGERRKLNLIERLNIAIDVACALDYLHNNCVPPIVHCDLKPSNVLLNDDMVGHVSDFGLARFLPDAVHKLLTNQTSSIGLKGSPGYIAPEYGAGGQVAAEGDVYSYGVLVLEMFTGKRPTDDIFNDGFNLHRFAEEACSAERVVDIIDATLIQEMGNLWNRRFARKLECLTSIMRIGVTCSSESLRDRPRIMEVVGSLTAIKDTLRKLDR